MSVEQELLKVTGVTYETSASRQDCLAALARAVASLSDDVWGKLTDAAQEWFNVAANAINEQLPLSEPDQGSDTDDSLLTDTPEEGQSESEVVEQGEDGEYEDEAEEAESDGEEEDGVENQQASYSGYRSNRTLKVRRKGRPKGDRIVIHSSDRIIINVTGNPKKPGSAAYKKWELYEDGISVQNYCKKGGSKTTIRWDIRRGLISLDKKYRFRVKNRKITM